MEKYLGVKLIEAEPCENYRGTQPIEGYRVVYEDGYESWSPKAVFEKAYRRIDNLTFGLAIEALKLGLKVCREGWNGKGLWLELQVPDKYSKMSLPYIYLNYPPTPREERVPWAPSQTDVLAEDWRIIEE